MMHRLRSYKLALMRQGGIYWDREALTLDELSQRFTEQVNAGKTPQINLRADKEGKYDTVAQVLAEASKAGLGKIAFVSE